MNQARIITMGCRLNIAESEAIASSLEGQFSNRPMVIINSCAVTNNAIRQTRAAIRKAHREAPESDIVVTGCAAQIDPDTFSQMPEVRRVIGNADKFDPDNFRIKDENADRPVIVSDIMQLRSTAPQLAQAFDNHSRAFVEIQNGCDHRCTFCIIPFGRGNSRSVPAGAIVDQITRLVDRGFREIVLTGVDVTSYGADLPGTPNLGQLVERILRFVPALPRLRLSSLDGIEIDDRLFALLTQEPRMMPHVHLSLQAGDDMILKRMKRRHNRAQAINLVERLKAARPEIAVGADIIAGFPTETDAMFANSVDMVQACQIVHGHIFPYSARTGTPAAKMPQVDGGVIRRRAKELRSAVAAQKRGWLDNAIGTRRTVLVEKSGHAGMSEDFIEISLDQRQAAGALIDVTICAIDRDIVKGNVSA
jgi:threonylcarbamoyladenosine tRNA methylthiotransferase MtaB